MKIMLIMPIDRVNTENSRHDRASRSRGMPCLRGVVALGILILTWGCQRNVAVTPSSKILEINSASFEREVLESPQPVLLEFWAPWCQPCLEMVPDMEFVAEEFSGTVKMVRTRIDENEDLATRLGVNAPPAVVMFKKGGVIKIRHGRQSAEALAALLEDSLTNPDAGEVSPAEQ